MSLSYNKFVAIPRKHYEEMATVYYNKLSQIGVASTNISEQQDLPSKSDDSCTFNSIFNSGEISTHCTHGQADFSAGVNHAVSDSSSDSDCVIINEITSSCTSEIDRNSAPEYCVSKWQTPLDYACPYCDHFSSSYSSSSSTLSSIPSINR